jgi:hypothetical protein
MLRLPPLEEEARNIFGSNRALGLRAMITTSDEPRDNGKFIVPHSKWLTMKNSTVLKLLLLIYCGMTLKGCAGNAGNREG